MSVDVLALIASVLAIGAAGLWYRAVLAAPTSTAKANEIAAAIRAGAEAFLSRQYRTVAMVGVPILLRDRLLARARLVVRGRLRGRRARERGRRLHRHERLGARERARREGRAAVASARRSISPSRAAP